MKPTNWESKIEALPDLKSKKQMLDTFSKAMGDMSKDDEFIEKMTDLELGFDFTRFEFSQKMTGGCETKTNYFKNDV